MDSFLVHEGIGGGKYSTVYRGRKKGSVVKKNFALKSIDKLRESTLPQEVRILKSLDHSNVVKFYDWYETCSHWWLILEYCGEGDLQTLLKQDSKLPEDEVHNLARDLVEGLRYVHSKDIIHCDLKPSNILFDVHGCAKICDFRLARELSDISKTPSSLLAEDKKRGSPSYMAPELFNEGGVHSYASDIWALGCVLYECYAGRPPFIGEEYTKLVKSIITDPTPPLPGNPSRPFVDLVNCLLIKDPIDRIKWSGIYSHDFWATQQLTESESPRDNSNETSESEDTVKPSEMLWHGSDLLVLPVMTPPSKKSTDVVVEFTFSFDTISTCDFVKLKDEKLDEFTKPIVTILKKGKTPIDEKQKVIRYLEMLSTDDVAAANILTNSSIMPILVNLLRQSTSKAASPALRFQLASFVALLLHKSTVINDELSKSQILDVLKEGLLDSRQEKEVKRSLMGALGELLTYISTQDGETKTSSGWQVSDTLISVVTSFLRKGEDDITQLYALRTIENVSRQGVKWSSRLTTTKDVINNLCYIFGAPCKEESNRLTAGSCLVRLVCFIPSTIKDVMEVVTFTETVKSISKQNPPEKQQICLNLLNMSLLAYDCFPDISTHLVQLMNDENLVPNLVSLVADGGEVLCAKSLLFITLLCQSTMRLRWLGRFFLDGNLLSTVDGLVVKEEEIYLQECLEVFLASVVEVIPRLLESVISDVQQLMKDTSKKTNLHLFPLLLNLLKSSSFKCKVVDTVLLQLLQKLIKLVVESSFQGRDDLQISVVRVLETITEQASLIEQNREIFVYEILPSVSTICKGSKVKKERFFCMKIWYEVVNNLVRDSSSEEELIQICMDHYLPLYPHLEKEQEPIPKYAEKVRDILGEAYFIYQ